MVEDFDAWYAQLRPPMLAALGAWCGDPSVADEALDEAFVRACERWNRVRRSPSPSGWVWRTATNLVRRHHRRHALEQRLLRRHPTTAVALGPDPDDLVDLRAALLRLTERQRTVVVLHHLADLSHADVADALGIAVGTVAATLHQARARLAADLDSSRTAVDRAGRPPTPPVAAIEPPPSIDGATP